MYLAKEIQDYISRRKMASVKELSKKPSANSCTEAMKCFVLEEDRHKLHTAQPFNLKPSSIRVSKKNTSKCGNKLKFVLKGPTDGRIEVTEESNCVEKCEIFPKKPGKYELEVFWNRVHIQDSPFSIEFKLPIIASSELDLNFAHLRLGIEHQVTLNCIDLDTSHLQVTANPQTAANITVHKKVTDSDGTLTYTIVPLEIGDCQLSVMYYGNHILNSPYNVEFGCRGNASKCVLSTSPIQHKIGTKVALQVNTSEAGWGELTADVVDVASKTIVPVSINKQMKDLHTLEFDPGSSSECKLQVKYDQVHITGSPFRLVFKETASCQAEGAGLHSAQAGAWNTFRVRGEETCQYPGALRVNILRGDEKVESVVSARNLLDFDVSYRPKAPGVITIELQWGEVVIPGSPFSVACESKSLTISKRPSTDVPLGSIINFTVKPKGESKHVPNGEELMVSSRDCQGKETLGYAVWDEAQQVYCCGLEPEIPGKYPISIKLNSTHIQGSPFVVSVTNSPSPQLVKAWGSGLAGTTTDTNGTFTVDTSKAGRGVLSVGVRDHMTFDVNTTQESDGIFKVCYSSLAPGSYLLDVNWSGEAIPSSPFNIAVTECETEVSCDQHVTFLDAAEETGIHGNWFKVWRTSKRWKKNNSKFGVNLHGVTI